MKIIYNWKNNALSNTYKLFQDSREIGHIKISATARNAKGAINGNEFEFNTKGTFNQYTEVTASKDNKLIGKIQYDNWTSKAEVLTDNKALNWKYDNTWNSKWSLFGTESMIIYTLDSSTKGQIESNTEDALLLLCGFFIKNHFWQRTLTSLMVVLISCMIVFIL